MSERFVDLYPVEVSREVDRKDGVDVESGCYRRVFQRMAVKGLPSHVPVGDVSVWFVDGPVRTQRTELRQRPGLPFTFDKHMKRAASIGEGEFLTVIELPVSLQDGMAIDAWRARTDAALGLLMNCLDERIAGRQLAEDVILMRDGRPVAAADRVALVRSVMPFEVTDSDRDALARLASADLDEANSGVRAAALYAAAAAQGPSRLGFLMMWLAVDAIVYQGRNQARELREALTAAGFVEAWLNMPVGRLAGLRGSVAHGKVESEELVYKGFYDVEAITRVLVPRAAGTNRAWPASPTATAFRSDVGARFHWMARDYEEVWHSEGLPPARSVPAEVILPPRYDAVLDGHATWIHVDGANPQLPLGHLRWAVWRALFELALELDEVRITVTDQHGYGPASYFAVSGARLLLSPAHPRAFAAEPDGTLVLDLCALFSQQQVLRLGVPPTDEVGAFFIEVAGAWAVSAVAGGVDAPDLRTIDHDAASLATLGQFVGYAIAGSEAAAQALDGYQRDARADPEVVALIGQVRSSLGHVTSLEEILEYLRSLAG